MIEAGRDRRGKKDVFYTWLGKVWLSGGENTHFGARVSQSVFSLNISFQKKKKKKGKKEIP